MLVLGRGYVQKNMTTYIYEALAINGHPAGNNTEIAMSVITNGFRVYATNQVAGNYSALNYGSDIYNYVALI